MGGAVNLQGGGQYQMPTNTGYGQNTPNMAQSGIGYGARAASGYDGGRYGDYGGGYGNVSTGGKGMQQPQYQPAPVLNPYVDTVSTGGKGMQSRPTPSQATAYAPMNIPQMSFARPAYYYPSVAGQMANMSANYGMGGLGAMGAYQPLIPRPAMAYQPQMGTMAGAGQFMPQQRQYPQYRQPQQGFDQNRLIALLSSLLGSGGQQPPAPATGATEVPPTTSLGEGMYGPAPDSSLKVQPGGMGGMPDREYAYGAEPVAATSAAQLDAGQQLSNPLYQQQQYLEQAGRQRDEQMRQDAARRFNELTPDQQQASFYDQQFGLRANGGEV